jgi:tight adherence protein B
MPDFSVIAVAFLVAVAVGGLAWAFLYPLLSGEARAEKRAEAIAMQRVGARKAGDKLTDANTRRNKVVEALKDLEEREKGRQNVSLEDRIAQAGLTWDRKKFYMISAGLGLGMGFAWFVLGGNLIMALLGIVVGGFGLPNWIIGYLRKRRAKAFLEEFPNAIDVIVRGIKSGLPLGDCLKIIAVEAREPVKGEFRAIVEAQQIGMTVTEACGRMFKRMPLQEANFFGIVIQIQQKAGGNLSEALGNLSRVLRERKKLKGKVQALSSEAKASASIIACLPIAVAVIVYFTTPGYISMLWTKQTGQIALVCCAFWMTMGVLIMRKMINFDV